MVASDAPRLQHVGDVLGEGIEIQAEDRSQPHQSNQWLWWTNNGDSTAKARGIPRRDEESDATLDRLAERDSHQVRTVTIDRRESTEEQPQEWYDKSSGLDHNVGNDSTAAEQADSPEVIKVASTARGGKEGNEYGQQRKLCSSSCRFLLGFVVFLLVAAILFAALFALGVLENDDLRGIPGLQDIDFEGMFDNDPYDGAVGPKNPEDAYRWYDPKHSGLELTVLNALSDDWQSEFRTAVSQWDNGQPDTLTLTTRKVNYDAACEPRSGLLKVCNADYGETDWRGVNAVLLDTNQRWISSSTAKMNEFYLGQASASQRQYTMCHEIGHGFGLPHWDEDFDNKNMGNCMDYTSRPQSNAQPDESNFEFLKVLYGEVGSTPSPSETPPPRSTRHLVGRSRGTTSQTSPREEGDDGRSPSMGEIPPQVLQAYRALLNDDVPQMSHTRRISATSAEDAMETSYYELDGESYVVVVHKLKPDPMWDE